MGGGGEGKGKEGAKGEGGEVVVITVEVFRGGGTCNIR